ncbi:RNA recognition motif domain-containing protein [Hirschfeldia incana]|nr:RNA recognition motif domain-containing protein [Hirschfeldia incana]
MAEYLEIFGCFSGFCNRFAYVTFSSKEEPTKALLALNGQQLYKGWEWLGMYQTPLKQRSYTGEFLAFSVYLQIQNHRG